MRARVAGRLAALLGSVVVGPGGCEGPSEPPGEEDEGGEPPPSGPPVILDVGEVVVSAAEREDISIAAADLLPTTRVQIDGRSWSLAEPGPVIRAGQTLRVPLGGALVVGQHELVLTHRVGKKDLGSEPLPIRVEAAELDPLLASLAPEVVGVGDRLIDVGPGERLLGVVDDAAQTVELRRDDWSAPGIVHALPGLAGAVDLTLTEVDDQRWLVAAWLADGGARVRARVTSIDADDQLGEPGELLELWNLEDPDHRALLGPHELAIDRGVALLDRMIVIAVEARRDAELASPGDHLLVTRWLDVDGSPAAIQVLRGPGGRDLDLPQRARMWLDLGASEPTLSVRLALAFPWLLELAGNGLPILSEDPGEASHVSGSPVWMAVADGALGSRHAFALELDDDEGEARMRAVRIDRWGSAGFVEASTVDVIELPAVPTGTPSLAMVAGSPTVLIPFGVGVPAWAMRSTGDWALLDSLLELGCDVLALAQPGTDGVGESQSVACIAGGELRVGALGLSPD